MRINIEGKAGIMCLALMLCVFTGAVAQEEIPLGTWRTHFSYTNVLHVEEAGNLIYASAENALFFFDKSDNSINKISKIEGLQGENISALHFDETTQQLLIGYASGNMDIISGNEIRNFDFLSSSPITGSKKINDIISFNGFAFIATDFGVLKFDLNKLEVKETYREIGMEGSRLTVYNQAIYNDSLFLATKGGLIAGNVIDDINLLDYRNWRRFGAKDSLPDQPVQIVANLGETLVVGINNFGLYKYSNSWIATGLLSDRSFVDTFSGNDQVLIADEDNVSLIKPDFQLSTVQNDLITAPNSTLIDSQGNYWIADGNNGVVSNYRGAFETYNPSGPFSNQTFALSGHKDMIYGVPGGFTADLNPLQNGDGFYVFRNGTWTNYNGNSEQHPLPEFRDITDAAYNPSQQATFLSSAGYGLLRLEANGQSTIIDENTPGSTLVNLNPPGRNVLVPAIEIGDQGVWLLNYGTTVPLQLLTNDNSWMSFGFSLTPAQYPIDLLLVADNVWMIIDSKKGGGIVAFDPETKDARYLTEVSDNGGLAGSRVNAYALDKDGYVWVGTNRGISVFTNPLNVFSGSVDALEPIFENRFLLRDENVTTIKIDGGNRKWIGTENGAWLFSADANQQLLFFNTENSPLPDNDIIDIEINEATGEVFFATSGGIVSYRGSATESGKVHSGVKVFPNPVTADFTGTVGISGLAQNAIVSITDISGKLVWQTRANGGTATWAVSDYNGRRAKTGIYLVFSASDEGNETFIAKIAVVD